MNRICLVTGTSSGMGASAAKLLHSRGWTVVGWDIQKSNHDFQTMQVDVSDRASVMRAWQECRDLGRISAMVNAAGVWRTCAFEESTLEFWRETFAINVEGVFNVCSAVIPDMKKAGGGSIVNISSLAVVRPPKIPSSAYAASKGAVLAFSRALAGEMGPHKIRVNCILPGAIETPMLTDTVTAAQLALYSTQSSLGRLGKPEEVAEVIAFLVSDQASLVHGASIEVAGV